MPSADPSAPVEELARAKVNLDLHVLGKRADGYHELDSLTAFADVGDHLVFREHDRLELALTGPFADALEGESDNLVLRAATPARNARRSRAPRCTSGSTSGFRSRPASAAVPPMRRQPCVD